MATKVTYTKNGVTTTVASSRDVPIGGTIVAQNGNAVNTKTGQVTSTPYVAPVSTPAASNGGGSPTPLLVNPPGALFDRNTGLPINGGGSSAPAPVPNPTFGSLPNSTYTSSTGYTYRTDANGTPTGAPILNPSSVINPDILGKNPTVTIPDKPIATDYSGLLSGLNATNLNATANAGVDLNTKNDANILQQFQDLIGTPPSTADAYNKAQEQTDLLKKQQTVNDLTANLNQIVTQGQTASMTLESQASGKGVTSQFLGKQQQEINRSVAIQALPVSAQLQNAQGNLDTAQQNVDTLFKIYSTDLTNAYNYRVQIATAFKDVATKSEDAKLNIFLSQITAQQNAQQAELKQTQDYAKMAFTNNQPILGSQLMGLDINSPTYKQDVTKLTSQIIDPNQALDTKLKQLQIQKAQQDLSPSGGKLTKVTINGVDYMQDEKGNLTAPNVPETNVTYENVEKSVDNLKFLQNTVKDAVDKSGASGTSGASKFIGDMLVGDTKYRQLESLTNTLKVNVLSLMTDPSIKKFFGPQMSNADVELMTSAGTTLNPEKQSPEMLKSELGRLQDLFTRMQTSIEGKYQEKLDTFIDSTGTALQVTNNSYVPTGVKL